MNSRERVIRALNHKPIDRAPRDLWILPGAVAGRADDLAELDVRFPSDVMHLDTKWPAGKRSKGHSQNPEPHTDAWGCIWQVGEPGVPAALVQSPLEGGSDIAAYSPPMELLDQTRFAKVNASCEETGRFVLAESEVRPLERLRQLRGLEAAITELSQGNKDLHGLLGRLHGFFLKELECWASTQVDGVVLGDDFAWIAASRGSLRLWQSLFKPLFREYCAVLHSRDKFVFFRCDGTSGEAIQDLAEIGVDALHAQWPQNEFESHASRYRGRVTFWGGVEQRKIEPPCHCREICDAVFRVRKTLDFGAGGVIGQAAFGSHTPLRSIITFFEQWLVALPVTT